MINNTTLVGRLTKNPELKYTGSGIAVVSFSLAVERNYTNAQGERETDFIMCQSWRGTAEIISKLGVKGALVGVTGNIQTRNYQNNEGRTIYITEVVVDKFQMLEAKDVTDARRNQTGQQSANVGQGQSNLGQSNTNNAPYTNQTQSTQQNNSNNFTQTNNDDPFQSSGEVTDIKDDDLPF